ncbi:MAG: hypothetical protein LBL46_01075, partial [Rickettsiales bacterium]|nr:hypothetical protein [Rickettsiales bacterium]
MKNQNKLLFIVLGAAFLSLVATLVWTPRAVVAPKHIEEIAVRSGDTLSSILRPYDLSPQDVMDIAQLLRREAKVRNLKADCDIVKIHRPTEADPVNRVVIKSDTWREIEFEKTAAGWTCNPRDIKKEIKIVRKDGAILDGDSFYSSGIRSGVPESVLADAYDLLAFEMDFERDMRAGQRFEILYEENYAGREFVDTGAIIAILFDAGGRRGNIKMYRFNRDDGRSGYYDEMGGG